MVDHSIDRTIQPGCWGKDASGVRRNKIDVRHARSMGILVLLYTLARTAAFSLEGWHYRTPRYFVRYPRVLKGFLHKMPTIRTPAGHRRPEADVRFLSLNNVIEIRKQIIFATALYVRT